MRALSFLLTIALLSWSGAWADVDADLRTLLQIGPREVGTAGNTAGRAYLTERLRALGYDVREEDFTYARYQDPGSTVTVRDGRAFDARALHGGRASRVSGTVAWVRGVGSAADFARAGVRGRIAVVMRGGMLFRDKARNARVAGATALIIVNTDARVYRGAIGDDVGLPVVSVSREARGALTTGSRVELDVRVRRESVRGVNVVASLPGANARVLVGAHHDSFIHSPGLNDNASGVAGVLEVARLVRSTPLANDVMFAFFDGEEDGLQGSLAFVRRHVGTVRALRGMLSLDMIGVNAEPLGVSGSASLVQLARRVIPDLRVFHGAGLSDHDAFIKAGVPAAFLFRGIDANYHERTDTRADPELVREAARAALSIARALAPPR